MSLQEVCVMNKSELEIEGKEVEGCSFMCRILLRS